MEKVVLQAEKRETIGKQVKTLRRDGKLPAVIYGRHIKPVNINLDAHSASLTLNKISSSSFVTISLGGEEHLVLVREKQRDYIKNRLLHVDFLAVSQNEKLRASVSIQLTGASLAVKDFSAVLVQNLESLNVECLPADLPERVVVDIAVLEKIGDGVRVKDLQLSDKIRVIEDPETMIVVATPPKIEEDAAAGAEGAVAAGTPSSSEPELSVERGKKDEEGSESK